MQILHLLALSTVFLIQETEPASILKGGENGNYAPITVSRILSDSSISSSSTSTGENDSDSDSASGDGKWLSAFKNIKGRRRFSFAETKAAWDRMNVLTGKPGYIIRLYRSRSEDKNHLLTFEHSPDNLHFADKKINKVLIQAEISDNKRLCIFTQDPLQEHTFNLERFVKEMIAAKEDEKSRSAAFKKYKKQMGLPKFGFDYKIYAWETNSDCAFYNLDNPRTNAAFDQHSKTNVATEIVGETTYTIQISQTSAQVEIDSQLKQVPINLMFMNRYKGTNTEISCRVKPVPTKFESLVEMYKIINEQNQIEEINELKVVAGKRQKHLCTALFRKSLKPKRNADAFTMKDLASQVDQASRHGVNNFRTQSFGTKDLFSSTFDAFSNGDNEVILATWEPIAGSCHFPEDDDEPQSESEDEETVTLNVDEIRKRFNIEREDDEYSDDEDDDEDISVNSDEDDDYYAYVAHRVPNSDDEDPEHIPDSDDEDEEE